MLKGSDVVAWWLPLGKFQFVGFKRSRGALRLQPSNQIAKLGPRIVNLSPESPGRSLELQCWAWDVS